MLGHQWRAVQHEGPFSKQVDGKHLSVAQQRMPDPNVDVRNIVARCIVLELDLIERGARVAEEQQPADELVHVVGAHLPHLERGDAQAAHEPPLVAPAPGEHARPHRLVRRQEAEDVLEDAIRQGADQVPAARHRRQRFSVRAPTRNCVEQVVGGGKLCGAGWERKNY